MTNSRDGSSGLPSDGNNDFIREGPAVASGSGGAEAYAEVLGFDSVGSEVGADRVSGTADGSVEDRCSDPGVVNVEGEVSGLGDASGETLEKALISGEIDNGKKKNDLRIVKTEQKKLKSSVEDYDSMLSEFDHFASKGVGEAVGYGYEIGDMVWGKVKSHPWWPGYIYNEAFASPSVWRAKRNGHVLVAFFGDGSYGWFELAELIPFAENFGEKSRQTTSRSFVKAVEEAVGEFSRRRSLALACRCRNDFNFWPSKVEGYYVVDVGDYEPGVYSLSQINKSREDFEPKEMLSFIDQLALKPRANQHNTIEFIKNKATALATRRAMFEEFDETYAQAFGSTPVRPERPTMPVAVDPAKAPLSGPLVFAETLGKGKVGAKITKIKEQVEDKYIFKRRDESPAMNIKKETMELASSDAPPLLVDGSGLTRMPVDLSTKGQMHHVPLSGINDSQLPGMSRKVSIISDVKPPEGSRKIIQGGIKKVKVKKEHRTEVSAENAALVEKKKRKKAMGAGQPAGELNSASVNLVEKKRKKDMGAEQPAGELSPASINLVEKKKKKRKKEIGNETSPALPQLPVAISSSGATADKVSGMLVDIPVIVKNELDTHQDVVMSSSSPTIEKQQVLDMRNIEFSMLLRDLHALALNPFHGAERGCPARVQQVFLNFRTLVYQKSLVLFPSVTEKGEAASAALPASAAALRGPTEKTKDKKLVKPPLVRADDPTKGGKKRGPSDRPEVPKKKRLDESIGIDKKKRDDSDGIVKKKKMVGDLKSSSAEKKIAQRPAEMQRENMKAIASKTIPSAGLKGVKLESGKRVELPSARTPNTPTMLTLKFPSGAALPSGAELRAKFTRFGPMDHTATRILWKSYTCRLVFRKKADAEAALKYVNETSKLFGNADVRPFLREVEVDAPEPEPVKVQRNDSSIEPPRTTSRVPTSHQQQQLKSCLKKPVSGEEGGNGNGNGNGISNGNGNNNGRGTRVKFVLGGEGSNTAKAEQVSSSSIAATATASSSSYADKLDVSSKNLPKLIPESIGATTTITTTASTSSNPLPPPTHHLHPPHQFQRFPSNMLPPVSSGAVGEPPSSSSSSSSSSSRQMPRPPNKEDISQQFLNLLTRCSDVVNTLSGALGYVPYHSL